MAKTRKRDLSAGPNPWVESQRLAVNYFQEGRPLDAMKLLADIERDYADEPEALLQVVNAYYNMGNMLKFEGAIRRLSDLEGPKMDSLFGLADAYKANGRQALALATYQDAANRWPQDNRARDARRQIPELEQALFKEALKYNVSLDYAMDLFVMNDEVRFAMDHDEPVRARQLVKRLLRRRQDFVPGINNLVQIDCLEGKLSQAIETAERVLAINAEDVQAITLLVRLNFLNGRPEAAREFTTKLKQIQIGQPRLSSQPGQLMKMAEALTFSEDDQGMLALFQQFETELKSGSTDPVDPRQIDAGFYHLAAVAAYRLGKEQQAIELWNEALRRAPYFRWAKENLAEAQKPARQRGGIWAYPFEYWLLQPVADEISQILNQAADRPSAQAALQALFAEKYPRVIFLGPHLIARGDALSREFAVRIAASSAHPVLLEAAKGFTLGQEGLFKERLDAAKLLVDAGLISPGLVRLWRDGQWSDVLVLAMQVNAQSNQVYFNPEVSELAIQANQALMAQDGAAAQAALEGALAILPDDPLLLNNLGLAYELQGEDEKAHALLREIYERHPDNFFATIGVVRVALEEDDYARAHVLLDGLTGREEVHTTEFAALAMVEIELALAEKNRPGVRAPGASALGPERPGASALGPERPGASALGPERPGASAWLDLWERTDPDNPSLPDYKKLVKKRSK